MDGEAGVISLKDPHLPVGIDHFAILKLGLGQQTLDLHFELENDTVVLRHPERLGKKVRLS